MIRFRKDLEAEFGAQLFRKIDASLMTSDEKIIPETIREGELRQAYQKTTAVAETDFKGERCNFHSLLKHMQSIDRGERKEAFEAWAGLYEQISSTLEKQYTGMVRLRDAMAKKMGFKTYTGMAYITRNRFDYTEEDAARFREQVRRTITPAVAEIREAQRKRLGVDKLRYYDEGLKFPDGNAVPIGTAKELTGKARRMYREMSPESGALCTIPYLVCVDEFQHEVYEKPDMTPTEWRKTWREIEKKYMPWRDKRVL